MFALVHFIKKEKDYFVILQNVALCSEIFQQDKK